MTKLCIVIGSASSVEDIESAISTYLRNQLPGTVTTPFPLCSSNQMELSRRGLVLSQSLKFSCENRILQSFPEVERSVSDLQAILDTCLRYSGHGPKCLIPYAMYAGSFDRSQTLVPIPDFVMVWSRLSKYSSGVPQTVIADEDLISHLICNAMPHFVPNLSEISYEQLDALCFRIGKDSFFSGLVGDDFEVKMVKNIASLLWDAKHSAPDAAPAPLTASSPSRLGGLIRGLSSGLSSLMPFGRPKVNN